MDEPTAPGPMELEPGSPIASSTPFTRRPPRTDAPVATNSWARRRILESSRQIGLPPETAAQLGTVSVWYYNRIVVLHHMKGSESSELPYATNRYLVPISLALACEFKRLPIGLDRLLHLSGTPSKSTIAHAHGFLAMYQRLLAPKRVAARPVTKSGAGPAPPSANRPKTAPRPGAAASAPSSRRLRAPAETATPAPGPSSPPIPRGPVVAATLIVASAEEASRSRGPADTPRPAGRAPKARARAKQQTTNTWARKRIIELCGTLGIPVAVRTRASALYEEIVDLHTSTSGLPAGKRLELSPRLNWSLVYTAIYLSCRAEEYPLDLRDILGGNPTEGTLQEMYRLYRFYKRKLGLSIRLVDVKTFILSWLDGFQMSGLIQDQVGTKEGQWVMRRAIDIANLARGEASLSGTSTKTIAAGALTTALAERDPPTNRNSFYRAIADLLHISEGTIRFIVKRIAAII